MSKQLVSKVYDHVDKLLEPVFMTKGTSDELRDSAEGLAKSILQMRYWAELYATNVAPGSGRSVSDLYQSVIDGVQAVLDNDLDVVPVTYKDFSVKKRAWYPKKGKADTDRRPVDPDILTTVEKVEKQTRAREKEEEALLNKKDECLKLRGTMNKHGHCSLRQSTKYFTKGPVDGPDERKCGVTTDVNNAAKCGKGYKTDGFPDGHSLLCEPNKGERGCKFTPLGRGKIKESLGSQYINDRQNIEEELEFRRKYDARQAGWSGR